MSTRTYLFARVWSGFPADFPAELFDNVEDASLLDVLHGLAAQSFPEGKSISPTDPKLGWVRVALDRSSSMPVAISETDSLRVRASIIVGISSRGASAVPTWSVFHAEEPGENVEHIIAVLPTKVRPSCPVRFRAVSQNSIPPTQWLLLERDLQQFDSVPRNLAGVDAIIGWKSHPLKLLREEALRLSNILKTVSPVAPNRDRQAPAKEATAVAATRGHFSVSDLATRHKVNAEALRKRLDRWRSGQPDGAFIENSEAKSREAKYLYSEQAVMPVIESMKSTSGTASGERPAP